MCATACLLFSLLCVVNAALASSFESEDVVPVRINARTSGRFWKRSEEQPRFVLSAFGKDFTLNLVPDTSFIAPSFTIQRVKARDVETLRSAPGARAVPQKLMNRSEESEGHLRSCFYSGNVDQDQNSLVAVSLCSGIFGSFVTEGKEYLIEPKLHGGPGPASAEEPHVIRRRTFNDSNGVSLPSDHAAVKQHNGESFTHGDGDARREPRRRRFVSAPRFIETLVVADSTMTHFYGDEIKVRRHELILSCTHTLTRRPNKAFFNFLA